MQHSIKRRCSNHFPTRHIGSSSSSSTDDKAIESPGTRKRCSEVEVSAFGKLLPSTCSMQRTQCLLPPLQLPIAILQHDGSSVCLTSCQLNPFEQEFPLNQPSPLHSMGHPHISWLFPADHLCTSQTAALWVPAVQMPAEDTKLLRMPTLQTISSGAILQKFTASAIFPQSTQGFNGWKNQHYPTRSCFLAVFLNTPIQKLGRVTASAPWSQSSSPRAFINGAASNRESL